jgi:hypothetical protein
MSHSSKVRMEVLVDFLDDALLADHVLGPRDIEGMMSTLAAAGVKRVAWAYYGDGHGGLRMPQDLKDGRADYGLCRRTYQELGNPLQWAVEAGHRHGLEVYAYFKPYETGVSMVIPEGSFCARSSRLAASASVRDGCGEGTDLCPEIDQARCRSNPCDGSASSNLDQ